MKYQPPLAFEDLRTERDIVKYTEKQFEIDRKLLQQAIETYPIVAETIYKLKCDKAELEIRIRKLEKEIHTLQHERIPFHDLGQ